MQQPVWAYLIYGLAAAGAVFLAAYYKGRKDQQIANLRVAQDLQIEYDRDLRNRRINHYLKLWSFLLPLARYPEPGPLSYDSVAKLSTTLRDWYFKRGGLFMSNETRDCYFNLQDGIRIVVQKHEDRWPLDNIDTQTPEGKARLMEHLRRGDKPWELPKEVLSIANSTNISNSADDVPNDVFDDLRELGSLLRSSLARDVLTRSGSYLGEGPT